MGELLMLNTQITFTEPWKVEVTNEPLATDAVKPSSIVVEKKYTLISAGTELACLSGNEAWFAMPKVPGYSAVSEVIAVGSEIDKVKPGDIIFHYGNHARYEVLQGTDIIVKVPEGIPLHWIPYARIATIAMTAIRVSTIELGDHVGVTGLGLVGNMAAQLAQLQGAKVIGIDLEQNRRDIAKQCGIYATIDGKEQNMIETIQQLTEQQRVSTLIEATGVPQVVTTSLPYIAPYGELILLGSPRGQYEGNITELLNYSHLISNGCITFKGAHEWRLPTTPNPYNKHSLIRNTTVALELMKSRALHIEPLISHILSPETDAANAYEGLRNNKDQYHGVLFDWTKLHSTNEVRRHA